MYVFSGVTVQDEFKRHAPVREGGGKGIQGDVAVPIDGISVICPESGFCEKGGVPVGKCLAVINDPEVFAFCGFEHQ